MEHRAHHIEDLHPHAPGVLHGGQGLQGAPEEGQEGAAPLPEIIYQVSEAKRG